LQGWTQGRHWREALAEYLPRDWVFTAVLVVFVAVVVWFARQIYDFVIPSSVVVTVPSFVGQTLVDADAEVTRLNLSSAVIGHRMSDRYPKDVVIAQRPLPGQQVRQGRQLSFVISDGMIARVMPDLRYESMREVGVDLARAHLQLGKVAYVKDDFMPAGHVISQVPPPLSSVHEGDSVNVTVSRGGKAVFRVPDFIGMPVQQARDLARKAGITLGQIVWTPLGSDGPPHGIVARQVPAPKAQIAAFQPVSLQVSAGPNESGYIIRQVHVLASVPNAQTANGEQDVDVRLTVSDATGRYDLYHAYARPGQKLDFTVTAVGTSLLDMYVNGSLVGEARLGTEPADVYGRQPSQGASPAPF
jgi:beta-lactam-binding protein with PASTA domain